MSPFRDDAGLALLYTALLLPTFLILLAFVVELGALRVTHARLVSAADLAATAAVNEQDVAALARDGTYHLSPLASGTARDLLADELRPLAAVLDGTTPDAVAVAAKVDVLEPASVRIAFDAPVRAPLLVLASLAPRAVLHVSVTAAAR